MVSLNECGTSRMNPVRVLAGQRGVALLTTLLIMLVMTVIGIASLTLTGLEKRIASHIRGGESAAMAAEACLSTSVSVIQQSISNGTVPAALLDNANPAGPVPQLNKPTLDNEIRGVAGFESFNDALPATYPNFNVGVPRPNQTLNNFTVQGDIDRLYLKAKAGSGMAQFAGYEGTGTCAASGGTEILYQLTCLATNAATNIRAQLTAIYSCVSTGESCQRKI